VEPLPCPGCKTLLEEDVTCCPICTRPRKKQEIKEAYEKLALEQTRGRKRPFKILFYLLIYGGLGYYGYQHRDLIIAKILAVKDLATQRLDEASDPKRLVPGAEPAPAPPADTNTPPPSPNATPSSSALPLPSYDPKFQWVLKGKALNLITLAPCPHARLVVRVAPGDTSAQPQAATTVLTDEQGQFAAVLIRLYLGNYQLIASDPAYASPAFYEPAVPYPSLSLENRLQLVSDAVGGEVSATPVVELPGQAVTNLDVYLAPRS
jgi:hypothetical protein